MNVAYPYLGTCWSGAVDWDPLRHRADYFDDYNGRAFDHRDLWQYANFARVTVWFHSFRISARTH